MNSDWSEKSRVPEFNADCATEQIMQVTPFEMSLVFGNVF